MNRDKLDDVLYQLIPVGIALVIIIASTALYIAIGSPSVCR